jgi:transcriptional regulator with XRE-family HTH domain
MKKAGQVLAERLEALPHGEQGRVAGLAGIHPGTMSRYRKAAKEGKVAPLPNPRLSQLEDVAEALNVGLADLFREAGPAPAIPPATVPSPHVITEKEWQDMRELLAQGLEESRLLRTLVQQIAEDVREQRLALERAKIVGAAAPAESAPAMAEVAR